MFQRYLGIREARRRAHIPSQRPRFGHFDELQDRVIGRIRLIAGICVPTISDIRGPVLPKVLCWVGGLICGDHVELRVFIKVIVGQRVNVQFRGVWFASKNTQTLGQLLLKLIGKVSLSAEEYDASARDCSCSLAKYQQARENKFVCLLVIAKSRRSSSLFGAFIHSTKLASENSVPTIGVDLKDL